MNEKTNEEISNLVKENNILLFMKGNPNNPKCGFSAKVVNTLLNQDIKFNYFDVLENPEIREGIKKFSNWPTIPQLYVGGNLIGGCDIIIELDKSGELNKILKN